MQFSGKAMRILCVRYLMFLVFAGAMLGLSSHAAPPFAGTIFIDPDIVVASDPTAYQSLEDKGRGIRLMFDRRVNNWVQQNAFLFEARFDDGLTIEVQVNPEFSTSAAARTEALRYMHAVGQMPHALRANVQTMWLHKGNQPFGGGNNNILIHSEQADSYIASGILEETLMHEAAHTSLDPAHAAAAGWIAAQQADPEFISTYARDNPTREDVAETFVPYFAVQFRRDRISASMAQTIIQAIPNRIAYLNAQNFNIHPATAASPAPLPTITLDSNITPDDIVNRSERAQTLRVTGVVGGDAKAGDTVTLTVNGTQYTGAVQSGLNFGIDVPGNQLVADADLTIEAVVTSGGSGGAVGTASDVETFTYDLTLPSPPTLTLMSAPAEEPTKSATNEPIFRVNLVGTGAAAAAAGDRVVLYEQGVTVGVATLSAADIEAGFVDVKTVFLSNGVRSFTAIITDVSGNVSDPSSALIITIEASGTQPIVLIASITPDNVINKAESTANIRVFGTVEGAKIGDPITLVIGDENFNQDLSATLTFSFTVPAATLIGDADKQIQVVARTENADGNVEIGVDVHDFEIDLDAPARPVLDLLAESDTGVSPEDNLTSIARPTLRVIFSDLQADDRFEITREGAVVVSRALFADEAAQGFVNWTSDADLNGGVSFRARLTDRAGNTSEASEMLQITIDKEGAAAELRLNSVTDDNIMNLRESTNVVTLSGFAAAGANAGDSIVIMLGAEAHTTMLDATLRFALEVPGSALIAATNRSVIASITTSDPAGNSQTTSVTNQFGVDLIAPTSPVLDLSADSDSGSSATDNYTSNSTPRLVITWNASGEQAPATGDGLVLSDNGLEVSRVSLTPAAVARGDEIVTSEIKSDKEVVYTAILIDTAGNSSASSPPLRVTLDTQIQDADFLPLFPISNDNVIGLDDLNRNVLIAGMVHVEKGVVPSVTIATGSQQAAAIVTPDSQDSTLYSYEIALPGAQLAANTNGLIIITAAGTDAAGNHGTWTATAQYSVEIAPPSAPAFSTVTLNPDAGTISVKWTFEAGREYALENSADLISWQPIATTPSVSGNQMAATVSIDGAVQSRFFRLRVR